jgi:glucose 1-dehydrogenase
VAASLSRRLIDSESYQEDAASFWRVDAGQPQVRFGNSEIENTRHSLPLSATPIAARKGDPQSKTAPHGLCDVLPNEIIVPFSPRDDTTLTQYRKSRMSPLMSRPAAAATRRPHDFSNKTVLVTGGNAGIGRAIAAAFVQAGASVAIASRNSAKNREAVRSLKALGPGKACQLRVDLSMSPEVESVVSRAEMLLGPLDILVNNAAHFSTCPLADLSLEEVERMMAVNFVGPLLCSKIFANAAIRSRRQSVIINVSSISGLRPFPNYGLYSATKAALDSLTKSMAVEWGPHGIRVNGIAPGHVRTESILADIKGGRLNRKAMQQKIPLGDIASKEQIADLVLFLSGPSSDHIAGQTIVIDGGQTIYL